MAPTQLPLCYRLVLRLCPQSFRAMYESELVSTVMALRQDPHRKRPVPVFWLFECWALYRVTARVRAQERRRTDPHLQPPGMAMMLETVLRDVRISVRVLRRRPTFAAAAILTLGLGIGASTVVFSAVEGIVLRSLPYPDAEQLVMVRGRWAQRDIVRAPVTIGDVVDIREYDDVFSGVAAFWHQSANLVIDGEPLRIRVTQVTDNFFDVLRIPLDGPGFAREAANGVVYHRAFWEDRLSGDPNTLGTTVELFGRTQSVVGITRNDDKNYLPNYQGGPSSDTDVFSLLTINAEDPDRTTEWLRVFARLQPGVTLANAQSAMDALAATQRERFPRRAEVGLELDVVSIQSQVVEQVRPTLLALLVSVGLVVLIACANVANLLMMRATYREREFAVRRALGSGRLRLIGQLLTEHLVLASLGGVLGIGIAALGIRALHILKPGDLPRLENVGLGGWVFAFVVGAILATTLVFGLWPATRAARKDPYITLRSGGGIAVSSKRTGQALAAVEVALSVILLVGTGLMVRTVWELQDQDPGFAPAQAVTVPISMSIRNLQTLEEEILNLPQVSAVGSANLVPFAGGQGVGAYALSEDRATAADNPDVDFRFITPGYLAAVGTPQIRGRPLAWRDFGQAVVIDDRLAADAWPGADPIGQHIWYTNPGGGTGHGVVVGIVGHMRHESLREEGRGTIFALLNPAAQSWPVRVVVRTERAMDGLVPTIRDAVRRIDPAVAIGEATPLAAFVDEQIAPTRFVFVLLAAFAGVALVLAAVGLYGVLAFGVSQRRREIGVRMAFGANATRVRWSIVRQGVIATSVGLVLGIGGSIALARVIEGFVYGVTPTDPLTYGIVVMVLLMVATAASLVPARQATNVDPTAALRNE